MRIDANCDGLIDWDEFSSHMLLEGQAAQELQRWAAGRPGGRGWSGAGWLAAASPQARCLLALRAVPRRVR
jgi:hypothetical protein